MHSRAAPLVSVFMPVYNGALYLAAAIESVLAQTHRALELVVVDDGSSDDSAAIAERFAASDSRVRVVRHDRNRGLSAARNTGLQSSVPGSAYLMNHDCDDISLPRKLEILVGHLERHPKIHGVGCFAEYFDDAGRELGGPNIHTSPWRIRRTFGDVNSMIVSATLVRRTMIDRVGLFDPAFRGCDDYDFWARCLLAGFDLQNLPIVLHRIRIHAASMSQTQAADMQRIAIAIQRHYETEADAERTRLPDLRLLASAAAGWLTAVWNRSAAAHKPVTRAN